MNTNSVLEYLGSIKIGTIFAWGSAILLVVTAIWRLVAKLLDIFKKYNGIIEENNRQRQTILEHDDVLNEIKASLDDIKYTLNEQKGVNLRQLRYTIVHTCDEALSDGKISAGKLKSLIELYDEYVDVFNGNGYVKIMVEKVKGLPVVGKLDE